MYSIKTFYIKPNSAARVKLQLLRAAQLFSLDITQNKLLNLMCRNLLRCHRWQIEKKWKLFARSSRQSKFASYHNFAFASTERNFIKMKNGFFSRWEFSVASWLRSFIILTSNFNKEKFLSPLSSFAVIVLLRGGEKGETNDENKLLDN